MFDDAKHTIISERYAGIQKIARETTTFIGEIGYYYPAKVCIGESGSFFATHEYNSIIHTFESIVDLIEWELQKRKFDFVTITR